MLAETLVANLITIAQAYAEGHGMTLEAVGRKFYGNSRFFPRLQGQEGRSISVHKMDEMIAGMKAHWPPKTEFPRTRAVLY